MKRKSKNTRFHFSNARYVWGMLLLSIALLACDKVKKVSSFPIDKPLKGSHIAQLDTLLHAYAIMKAGDQYLFYVKKEPHFVYVFDRNLTLRTKALRQGHGQGEWIAPMPTGQMATVNGRPYACVLERETHTLYGIDLSNPESPAVKIEDFSQSGLSQINYVFRTGDGRFIGSAQDKEMSELFVFRKNPPEVRMVNPADIDPKLFDADKFGLSQTRGTFNERQGKMADCYFTFPLIHITDAQGEGGRTIQIGNSLPAYTAKNAPDAHFYFNDICSTDTRLYLLYDDPEKPDETSILVFDWDGNPMARYRTPRLVCFTVDEAHQRFIAIPEDDSHGICFEFPYRT